VWKPDRDGCQVSGQEGNKPEQALVWAWKSVGSRDYIILAHKNCLALFETYLAVPSDLNEGVQLGAN
jgi:hypothetical protein